MKKIKIYIILICFFTQCSQISNNKVEVVWQHENGDTWKRFYHYKSKLIAHEGRYRDTIPIGLLRAYTINGLIISETNFNENGQANGLFRYYYDNFPNGNYIEQEGQYFEGKPIGYWKFFRPNGTLNLIFNLDSNSKITYYARFNENGILIKDTIGYFDCDTSKLW